MFEYTEDVKKDRAMELAVAFYNGVNVGYEDELISLATEIYLFLCSNPKLEDRDDEPDPPSWEEDGSLIGDL
jgi:hypothetical protein